MSRLADLLGHDHPLFAYNMAELERASGNAGIDTRLIADINERAHQVIRALGLDGADTFPDELYLALNAAVRRGEAGNVLGHTQYVLAMVEGEVVSLNIKDVVENSHHQLPFVDRQLESARRHLRAEVIRRYAAHDRITNDLVRRLSLEAGLLPDRDVGHELQTDDESVTD